MTLVNAACGIIAGFFLIKFAIARNISVVPPLAYLTLVWLFIFFGGIFDWLDGIAARWLRVSTELGKELDSLCDAVTFGVVPAMIIVTLNNFGAPLYWEIFSWACAIVYLSSALFRLARFDVGSLPEAECHQKFKGMPMPAAGGMVAVPLLLYVSLRDGNILFVRILWGIFSESSVIQFSNYVILALPFLGLLIAYLMVSEMEYIHFNPVVKFFMDRGKFEHFLYLAILLSLVILLREMVILLLPFFFAGYGPTLSFYKLLTGKSKKSGKA